MSESLSELLNSEILKRLERLERLVHLHGLELAALRELTEKAGRAPADDRFERSLCEALNTGNGSYKP